MRVAVTLVIILGILIFLGLLALAYGIGTRMAGLSGDAPTQETVMPLPSEARILETTVGGGYIVLRIETPGQARALIVLDPLTGKRQTTIHLDRKR